MKLFYLLVAMASIAFSASLPGPFPHALASRQVSNSTNLSTADAVAGNTSLLLGWQLAGAALDRNSLEMACKDIDWLGNGKWTAVGLKPEYIKEAFCKTQNALPNATAAIPHTAHYATEVYISQLFGALAEDSLGYFCEKMGPESVDQLRLNGTRVKEAACKGSRPDTSYIAGTNVNSTVAWARKQQLNHTSRLFADLYTLSSTNTVQTQVLCQQFGYASPLLFEEGLDADIIRTTVCGTVEPIDVQTGKTDLVNGLSNVFAI